MDIDNKKSFNMEIRHITLLLALWNLVCIAGLQIIHEYIEIFLLKLPVGANYPLYIYFVIESEKCLSTTVIAAFLLYVEYNRFFKNSNMYGSCGFCLLAAYISSYLMYDMLPFGASAWDLTNLANLCLGIYLYVGCIKAGLEKVAKRKRTVS